MPKALIIPLEKHNEKHRFFEMVTSLQCRSKRAYVASYLMLLAIMLKSWTALEVKGLFEDEKKNLEALEYLGWISLDEKGGTVTLLEPFQKECEKQVTRYHHDFTVHEHADEHDCFKIGKYNLYVPKARELLMAD